MVGPGGGEREELVEGSAGIAVQVPTDEAPPQSPLPVTFVAIAPLLQHWLRRGWREGRQRRRREGGQRRRRQEVAPQQQTSSSHLLCFSVGTPPRDEAGKLAASSRGGGGEGRTCVRDARGRISGDGSVCLGATVTGGPGATIPVATLAAPLQLVWEREGFFITPGAHTNGVEPRYSAPPWTLRPTH